MPKMAKTAITFRRSAGAKLETHRVPAPCEFSPYGLQAAAEAIWMGLRREDPTAVVFVKKSQLNMSAQKLKAWGADPVDFGMEDPEVLLKRRKADEMAKKKAKKAAKPKGPGRPMGRTTGVGVQGTWVMAFDLNAKASKGKRLTDPQISKFMKKEFPGRKSVVFDRVQGVRTKYNKGGLTGGIVPTKQAIRYDGDGNVMDGASTPGPKKGEKNAQTKLHTKAKKEKAKKDKKKAKGKKVLKVRKRKA
jgi:hypothetical protein